MNNRTRIKPHEVDTRARKMVPLAIPDEWEYREATGRDYGIDMEVELFNEGISIGQFIKVQIKGTEKDIVFKNGISSFNLPKKFLKYSERFITPIILAVCPVNVGNGMFYYIWVQEYINSVLNFEKPDWRTAKNSSVSIKLLEENCMPNRREHLLFIAHYPHRLLGSCEIMKLSREYSEHIFEPGYVLESDFMLAIEKNLIKIRDIPGFFIPQWQYGMILKETYIDPAIIAIRLLIDKREPTEDEIQLISKSNINFKSTNGKPIGKLIENELQSYAKLLIIQKAMTVFYQETDYRLRNTLWNEYKEHSF